MQPSPSVAALLLSRAGRAPDSPLLLDADSARTLTAAEVLDDARRWAALFCAHPPGTRIAVVLQSSLDLAELYLGAALAGVTVCPDNPALADAELVGHALRSQARLALVAPTRRSLADAFAAHGIPTLTVGAHGVLPRGLPPPTTALPAIDGDAIQTLVMTSGTSGGSKACRLTQAALAWTAACAAEAFALDEHSRFLTPLPLFHVNAQVIGLLAAVHSGGAVALAPRLPAPALFTAAARVGATGLSTVPALVHDLLREPGAAPPSLAYAVCSSAPLPPGAREAFESRFGIPLLSCYGLTEASCFVSYSRRGERAPPGSVGRPLGCEVRVEGGEVLVRGPGIFPGYDGDTEATAAAVRDGWLHTGDLGRMDGAGYLFIEGRIKDLINRGGEKLSPIEIEAVLSTCPPIAECAVFAIADERLGEEVAAAVVLSAGISDDALWDHCLESGRLGEHQVPKRWFRLDALPRGGTGKVLRRELTRRFGSKHQG